MKLINANKINIFLHKPEEKLTIEVRKVDRVHVNYVNMAKSPVTCSGPASLW